MHPRLKVSLLAGSRISCRTVQQDEGGRGSWWEVAAGGGLHRPSTSTWRYVTNKDMQKKPFHSDISIDNKQIRQNLDACVHSCESPSCGRRDVSSCCCGGTCNIWLVSSVMTNENKRNHSNMIFHSSNLFIMILLQMPSRSLWPSSSRQL